VRLVDWDFQEHTKHTAWDEWTTVKDKTIFYNREESEAISNCDHNCLDMFLELFTKKIASFEQLK
jgi:hypothetical protein